jgi:uncharacterized protein YjbJ (UPF0337 family)
MTDDRFEGGMRKGLGQAQDALGDSADDLGMRVRGKFNEAAGLAQETVGQARERASGLYDDLETYTKDQPMAALAVALGLGLVVGLILNGGRRSRYARGL